MNEDEVEVKKTDKFLYKDISKISNGVKLPSLQGDRYKVLQEFPVTDYGSSRLDSTIEDASSTTAGSTVTITNHKLYLYRNNVIYAVELLGAEADGWVTLYEARLTHDWNFMIPIRRTKALQDAFNSAFEKV